MSNINTKEYWDEIYKKEGENTWRTYPQTFKRICEIVGENKNILEVGCGVGILGEKLNINNKYLGLDISEVCINICVKKNLNCMVSDINNKNDVPFSLTIASVLWKEELDYVIGTEFLEHFTEKELEFIMGRFVFVSKKAIFTVPNCCLGPEDCREHYQCFNEDTFRTFLGKYYQNVKIEYIIDYMEGDNGMKIITPSLLAICEK